MACLLDGAAPQYADVASGGYVCRHPRDGDLPELLRVAAEFGPGWCGLDHNVIPVPPCPLNIALPLAGDWAVVGIVATVFLVRTGRTGWLDAATRVYDEPGDPGRG
jgi:hypothetical protein